MKVTRRQIRQLIREAVADESIAAQVRGHEADTVTPELLFEVVSLIEKRTDAVVEDLRRELNMRIDEIWVAQNIAKRR